MRCHPGIRMGLDIQRMIRKYFNFMKINEIDKFLKKNKVPNLTRCAVS